LYAWSVPGSYWIETLGCPKNQVDSDKVAGGLLAEGYLPADSAESADVVVVNTCAFIDSAREESIETILDLSERRRSGARLVVTGCLAARSGEELAAALPEVDLVADLGVPVTLTSGPRYRPSTAAIPGLDLLELPRPPASAPWAYVKIAEGCDRACGFCAIPSFRGPQRSRTTEAILAEIEGLAVPEIVLVSQDLASWGRDLTGRAELAGLVRQVAERAEWVRLLYLYPSSLNDELLETIVATGVPYFDLSLQHVSRPHLRRMRRFGSAERFLARIEKIRDLAPDAALRSSFIFGYPGETEEDQDAVLAFLEAAQLDWVGLFPFSPEAGTYAVGLEDQVAPELAMERLREAAELQDAITASRRQALVGTTRRVLVDARGRARSVAEAPEIDGIVRVPDDLAVGTFVDVRIEAAEGPDLLATAAERAGVA
jgi:ribosomal protein S12 methylthiotransferase